MKRKRRFLWEQMKKYDHWITWKLIITFAIPLMLGNIFQQFYTMADTMIVGQVVGVEALAAVGAGDWLVWLVFGIMTGITQGFSILVAQFYGAREKKI